MIDLIGWSENRENSPKNAQESGRGNDVGKSGIPAFSRPSERSTHGLLNVIVTISNWLKKLNKNPLE